MSEPKKPMTEPKKRAAEESDGSSADKHIDPDRIAGDAERTVERTLEREEDRGVPRADHEPDVTERLE